LVLAFAIINIAFISHKTWEIITKSSSQDTDRNIKWVHLSSLKGDLSEADVGAQVSTLILDIDRDNKNDFVITGWGKPSMVWYQQTSNGWKKHLIDSGTEYIEAGGDFLDIDGDGDLDIVQGGDWRTLKEVWWWENPYPDFKPGESWNRYYKKNSDRGGKAHHDQIFGDFDNDGHQELVFWNTNVCKLFIAEIPENPKESGEWDLFMIHQFEIPDAGKYEGLAKGDIDLDGKTDIIGGGQWWLYAATHKITFILPQSILCRGNVVFYSNYKRDVSETDAQCISIACQWTSKPFEQAPRPLIHQRNCHGRRIIANAIPEKIRSLT
jgi:hypothetical protein